MKTGAFGVLGLILLALIATVAYSSLFVVHQTRQALVVRLGEPLRVITLIEAPRASLVTSTRSTPEESVPLTSICRWSQPVISISPATVEIYTRPPSEAGTASNASRKSASACM